MKLRQILFFPFWVVIFLCAAAECDDFTLNEFVIFKLSVVAAGVAGYFILNKPPRSGRRQQD